MEKEQLSLTATIFFYFSNKPAVFVTSCVLYFGSQSISSVKGHFIQSALTIKNLNRKVNFKMADNSVVEDAPWFSAELKILEAEYEKSKLRVLQDTLLCKRSMIELELLCKDELLQKNTRVNNRLKKQELQLQVSFC